MAKTINMPCDKTSKKIYKISWGNKIFQLKGGIITGKEADRIFRKIKNLFSELQDDDENLSNLIDSVIDYFNCVLIDKNDTDYIINKIDTEYDMKDGMLELIKICYVFNLTIGGSTQEQIDEFFRTLDESISNI